MDYRAVCSSRFFAGATSEEVQAMLGCLSARPKTFEKGERILRAGSPTSKLGIVATGSVCVESTDVWGNVTFLAKKGPGQVFGEAFACSPGTPLTIDATAAERCEVVLIDVSKLTTTCDRACKHHQTAIANLMAILAQQSLDLQRRASITAHKSIRARVLAYLSAESLACGSSSFEIAMNRRQLASYLGVDRSALSNELSKMQRDGLISVRRNSFTLNAR